ncbi:MAG: hypothetical protein RL375_4752 [Pseudomonadota bacterium]|jgi:AcrR family transcriptional regulator
MSTMPDTARDERRKAPRRTAERILATALALFNRRGEPNVSTTLISAELNISPGNLYYHYPAKEELVNALMSRYEQALDQVLADDAETDDPWRILPALLTLAWDYRFLFRDLNDLLARNRQLETRCQAALARQQAAVRARVARLHQPGASGHLLDSATADTLATSIVLLLTYWLSFEYVRDPRRALEPDGANEVLARGNRHVMALLSPYLAHTATPRREPTRAPIKP